MLLSLVTGWDRSCLISDAINTYRPKSCSFYRTGPTRKVPGRKGMTWEEENWVDDDAVSHRGMDE
jgi:hypothetical protein